VDGRTGDDHAAAASSRRRLSPSPAVTQVRLVPGPVDDPGGPQPEGAGPAPGGGFRRGPRSTPRATTRTRPSFRPDAQASGRSGQDRRPSATTPPPPANIRAGPSTTPSRRWATRAIQWAFNVAWCEVAGTTRNSVNSSSGSVGGSSSSCPSTWAFTPQRGPCRPSIRWPNSNAAAWLYRSRRPQPVGLPGLATTN